jgi:AGZA family xanthine/uracil permease-like MFS transporter
MVALGDVGGANVLLAIGTLVVTAALMQRRVPGAILIGIVLGTAAAWATGIATMPEGWLVAPSLPTETFMALDFHALLNGPTIVVIFALLFVDFFDTAGTLIGTGMLGGFVTEEGELPRANQAFLADAVGTSVGALLGTSTVTSYIESSAGIEEGGRSGLTAVVVGLLFLISPAFVPNFAAVPAAATAPALLVVGAMMLQKLDAVEWKKPSVAVPAFLTVAMMPLTFSIANGIAAGILSYTVIKYLSGEGRSVPVMMYLVSLILIVYYAFAR